MEKTKESGLVAEMNNVEVQIDKIKAAVEELRDRLAYVLGQPCPRDEGEKIAADDGLSPAVHNARVLAALAVGIQIEIKDILARLGL